MSQESECRAKIRGFTPRFDVESETFDQLAEDYRLAVHRADSLVNRGCDDVELATAEAEIERASAALWRHATSTATRPLDLRRRTREESA